MGRTRSHPGSPSRPPRRQASADRSSPRRDKGRPRRACLGRFQTGQRLRRSTSERTDPPRRKPVSTRRRAAQRRSRHRTFSIRTIIGASEQRHGRVTPVTLRRRLSPRSGSRVWGRARSRRPKEPNHHTAVIGPSPSECRPSLQSHRVAQRCRLGTRGGGVRGSVGLACVSRATSQHSRLRRKR
jgi:hypothetical protein